MSENNSLSIGHNNSLTTFQGNLSLNKNDKELLSYGASKIGLDIYNKRGRLKYDYVDYFSEGFAVVKEWYMRGGRRYYKKNYINKEGKELLSEWVPGARSFKNGIAIISRGGNMDFGNNKLEFNLINTKGVYLLNEWVDYIGEYSEGYLCVEKDGQQNYINPNGQFLFSERFDAYSSLYSNNAYEQNCYAYENTNILYRKMLQFSEGFAVVLRSGKRNYVDEKGNFLLNERSKFPLSGFSDGFGQWIANDKGMVIKVNQMHPFKRYINKEGEYVFIDPWKHMIEEYGLNEYDNSIYYDAFPFYNGHALIGVNGHYNFIDKSGNLLFKKSNKILRYGHAFDIHNNCTIISRDSVKNLIDTSGKILLGGRYEDIKVFQNGFAVCVEKGTPRKNDDSFRKYGAKRNFINKEGDFIFNERYENIFYYGDILSITRNDGKKNVSDLYGNFIFKERLDHIYLSNNSIRVEYPCLVNREGKIKSMDSVLDIFGNPIVSIKALEKQGYKASSYWVLYNKNGEFISKDTYDYIGPSFGDDLSPVRDNKKGWNFIDKGGNLLF